MSTTKQRSPRKNRTQIEVEVGGDHDGWEEFASPVSIMHVTSNARTLPSSHGSSSGSMRSEESSLEAPPQDHEDLDSECEDDAKKGWTTSKMVLVGLTFLLLFVAGILGGLLATGGFSSRNEVAPTNSANATAVTNAPTDIVIEVFDEPTEAPIESSVSTPPPTSTPSDNGWVTIPKPAEPITLSDGTYDYRANSEYLVGAYYYPWHKNDFHNNGGYMRKFVVPRQYPALGEYDDSDPAVIAEHMKMFRRANIGLLVTSWWGPNKVEDSTTKNVVMEHEDVGNLKISLFYETVDRFRLESGIADIKNAKTDIEYMCEHYFDHPNYYKVNGRPVLFIYLARTLGNSGKLEEALLTMRSEAAKRGHNIFLVGDYAFGESPQTTEEDPYVPFWYLDAVTNYDVYGNAGRPQGHAGTTGVSLYYERQAQWKKETAKENCMFIPAVSPGYNDRGVRLESDHPALSRRVTAAAEEGSLFHFQLKHAKKLADPGMEKLIMVNSFNEWHEDTQIEPVKLGDSAVWPPDMTQDLEYVGYGNLYLDILGASTRSEEGQGIFDYLYEY